MAERITSVINTGDGLATRWLTFRQPHTDDRCWDKTVLQTMFLNFLFSNKEVRGCTLPKGRGASS